VKFKPLCRWQGGFFRKGPEIGHKRHKGAQKHKNETVFWSQEAPLCRAFCAFCPFVPLVANQAESCYLTIAGRQHLEKEPRREPRGPRIRVIGR
jgi:hypothetical protein